MTTATAAGEFLVDLAKSLTLPCDPAQIHAVIERACGGQLEQRRPDGRRASTLTASGIPFEASVSGGRGKITPAIRYVTETGTQETDFASRVSAQLAAIPDLVARLPNGDESVSDMLQSFVRTLYPDPVKVTARHRFATWIGVVHHAAAPESVARLKIYGNLQLDPTALHRLSDAWPGFAGLVPVPDSEKLMRPAFAAVEVDTNGNVNHKIYLRARYHDVGVPMKLVRYFGHAAWEALSEFVRCGVDPAKLHEQGFEVCCTRGADSAGFGLYLTPKQDAGFPELVRELAARHHGTTLAVDALTLAAESCGASWRYSVVGLGCSPEHGIDKLNVYGVPTWSDA
ncbi:hypothetical protein ABTW96_11715 [Nocardia beijingensis]|uniref:hypothetical protein n=1 Tax=Nocardia beijingensis TaxID=95162 RepID=UPI003331980D